MREIFKSPQWDFIALLRIVPFLVLLAVVFWGLPGQPARGDLVLLISVLAAGSVVAWFVEPPKSNSDGGR